MATYPAGIYSYTNRTGTQTLLAGTHSTAHNQDAAEIIAIETELGTNPKGIYVDVGSRLDALAAAIGAQHTQNTDVGTSSATFYMNGASGALIKETGGAYAVRDNTDSVYVDFTCDDLTCATINGLTAVQLAALQTNTHSHVNYALLETYTQTEANLADAVSLRHTQNTDTGSTNETFQLNNVNPLNSAKLKVDDLTPTIVDIRNAGDNAFAPIRALEFRGDLTANNSDPNLPRIRYEDTLNVWQLSNNGTSFVDIAQGISMAGGVGEIQFNNTTNLGSDPTFYYNDGTNTLYIANINVSGTIIGAVGTNITGTTSDTFEVNTDGNGLNIDCTGLANDRTVTGEQLYQAAQNYHAAVTVLDSASVDFTLAGQQVTAAVLPAGVDHDSLNNYAANDHIDHTTVSISAGTGLTGGGDISASRTISLSHLGIQSLTDPDADRILFWDESSGPSGATGWLTVSTGLSLTGTNLTTNDGQIVHDNLSGYDANDHIDHTTVSISAGTGLTGGGDISSTRTLSLSHLGIQSLVDPNADRLMLWDDTDGSVQWVTVGTGLTYTHATHTLSATGTVTDLDSAYNGGSTITVDTGAVALTGSILNVLSIASNSNGSHIRLTGDPTVAAPVDGDLWYDGTSLNFYDGATTHDLLAGGGATLTRATFTNASLTAGVLTITHNAGLSAPYTVMVTVFDNNYKQIIPDSVTGATNSVAVDLSSYVTAGGGSISGTWGYGYIA